MSRLVFSPAAAADIDSIWNYTAETWGVAQAESYTDDIRDACMVLAAGERLGRKVDLREGYLKYQVGRHFLFYRATDTGIEVIRILHQSMDVNRHL